jgi:2-hydroxychromene-2-carboxylate isomerase
MEIAPVPAAIDFYFDFVSPYSYLASAVLPRLAAEHGSSIRYRPFCLVDLMKIVGNRPTTIECKNKGVYALADLQRWARRYQVSLTLNPHWQRIDFAELGRGALVAIDAHQGAEYIEAVYSAVWADALDLTQRSMLMGVLDKAGLDATRLLEQADSEDYVAKFNQSTAAAAERGIFGSPTMFVEDEMFFGNDRLDFMTEALRSAAR